MKDETILQNKIRLELSNKQIAILFRANVGSFQTVDGRYINSGLPKGFPDLFGFRLSDKKFVAIEVKTDRGRLSKEQKHMLNTLENLNVLCGVARSVEDAKRICEGRL